MVSVALTGVKGLMEIFISISLKKKAGALRLITVQQPLVTGKGPECWGKLGTKLVPDLHLLKSNFQV